MRHWLYFIIYSFVSCETWKYNLFTDLSFPHDNLPEGVDVSAVQWKRPHELCNSPQFIIDGTKRFDVRQGYLGNCWLLAAAAACAEYEYLLDKVMSLNQTFDFKDSASPYNGSFRFNFFQYDKWVEIIIDDRLPTEDGGLLFATSANPNEFWSCLLEKAYAKLHGGYANLKAGYAADAMTDLTGGIVETLSLTNERRKPGCCWADETVTLAKEIASRLSSGVANGKLLTTGITKSERASVNEDKKNSGLTTAHAYTISNVEQVTYHGQAVTLVRVRNPWGTHFEWNGTWSDKSDCWNELNEDDKGRVNHPKKYDGDFWISIPDFLKNFRDVSICSLTSDSQASSSSLKMCTIERHSGTWEKGVSAGGGLTCRSTVCCNPFESRKTLKRYATNPQFLIDINGDHSGKLMVVVELSQKHGRRNNVFHEIGFDLYKLANNSKIPVKACFFAMKSRIGCVEYDDRRTVTGRYALKKGKYVIIPCCKYYDDEAGLIQDPTLKYMT